MKRWLLCSVLAVAAACGPGRTTFAQYPGAPTAFDRAASEAKALEIADRVFATAGGSGWAKAKQIKWRQIVTADGKSQGGVQAWDRWNARHYYQLPQGEDATVNVAYGIYDDFAMGFARQGRKTPQLFDDASKKSFAAKGKELFNEQSAIMTIQFLMFEPGAKIAYVGQARDDKGEEHYDELKITFDDPMRKPLDFHIVVDRNTNLIQRIDIYKTGTTNKIGYTLSDWTDAGGLKFATKRGNMGYAAETTTISEIKVGDVEDDLYIAPVN